MEILPILNNKDKTPMPTLRSLARKSLCIVAILVLAACAQIPKQAFNRSANKDIKTIAILEPANSGEIAVQNLGHPGMSFGLIGGLIAAVDISAKTKEFTTLATQKSLNYVGEYQSALVQALENHGYVVKTLKVSREKSLDFLKTYDDLDPSVDAYLDMGLSCGYLSASSGTDYIPTVRSGVRLIKRSTKEVLYQDIVSYGYEMRAARAISIPAEPKYYFKDFEALKVGMDVAVGGLRVGFPLVANQIANDIRP